MCLIEILLSAYVTSMMLVAITYAGDKECIEVCRSFYRRSSEQGVVVFDSPDSNFCSCGVNSAPLVNAECVDKTTGAPAKGRNAHCKKEQQPAVVVANEPGSKIFNKKECEAGDAFRCLVLGSLYEEEGNLVEAAKYLQGSCMTAFPRGCIEYGDFLLKRKKDLNEALVALFAGCEIGSNGGCQKLCKTSNNQAQCLSQCEIDSGQSCINMGQTALKLTDMNKRKALFKFGCQRKEVMSCGNLSNLARKSIAVKEWNDTKAWLRSNCESTDHFSCYILGMVAHWAHDAKERLYFFSRACKKGHALSCDYLKK